MLVMAVLVGDGTRGFDRDDDGGGGDGDHICL